MKKQNPIQEELKAISRALWQYPAKTPFSLPPDYFATLPETVMKRVLSNENSPVDVKLTVPEGYFEQLPNQVLQKIRALEKAEVDVIDETKAISPIVAGLSRRNVFQVPEGYFEQLQPTIPDEGRKKARVVALWTRQTWVRYAAAAVVAFGLWLGGNWMHSRDALPESIANALKISTEEQFNQQLAQLSENEIYSYLLHYSDTKDLEAMTALLDEEDLPTATDYLNEEFWDSYFQQIETNSN